MQKLRTVSQAVVASRQVGAIEACYIISDVDLVQSSRTTININTLKDTKLANPIVISTDAILKTMDSDDSVVIDRSSNAATHRHAYGRLLQNQKTNYPDSPIFTFYEFLSTFHVKEVSEEEESKKKTKTRGPYEIKVDETNGFISNADSFVFNGYRYVAMKKRVILNMSPYIPFDPNKENSAFSTLLLYSDWGLNGEAGILQGEVDAVTRLKIALPTLPDYVQQSIRAVQRSEEVLADSGDPSTDTTLSEDEVAKNVDEALEGLSLDRDPVNNPYISTPQVAMGNGAIKDALYSCDKGIMSYLYNFIGNIQNQVSNGDSHNRLTEAEEMQQFADKQRVSLSDEEAKEELLHSKYLSKFSEEQRQTFEVFRDAVAQTDSKQVIMVLTGEGGTGKSDVIQAIRLQTQLLVGKVAGYRGPCVNMAPTGAAAFNIRGSTWQSCLVKGYEEYKGVNSISPQKQHELEMKFRGTRVVIIDEVSMVTLENLVEISDRCAFL